ncbi:MAG: gluconokinase [Gemmatimonadaceae bacterium]
MGVSGSGKSTIGPALARALDIRYVEGDAHHPAENVKLMAAGTPLTDANRAGWLRTLALRLRAAKEDRTGLVVSCSALKRSYRDILRAEATDLRLVFLRGEKALLAERLATRKGHFMPASLLESQLSTLEEPGPDENAWVCDITESPDEIVASLVARASA